MLPPAYPKHFYCEPASTVGAKSAPHQGHEILKISLGTSSPGLPQLRFLPAFVRDTSAGRKGRFMEAPVGQAGDHVCAMSSEPLFYPGGQQT